MKSDKLKGLQDNSKKCSQKLHKPKPKGWKDAAIAPVTYAIYQGAWIQLK